MNDSKIKHMSKNTQRNPKTIVSCLIRWVLLNYSMTVKIKLYNNILSAGVNMQPCFCLCASQREFSSMVHVPRVNRCGAVVVCCSLLRRFCWRFNICDGVSHPEDLLLLLYTHTLAETHPVSLHTHGDRGLGQEQSWRLVAWLLYCLSSMCFCIVSRQPCVFITVFMSVLLYRLTCC